MARKPIVDVNLNGDRVHFLIDTGATAMAVNPTVAAALISNGAASDAGTASVTLADGRSVDERRIIINKITLGTHSLFNIVATVNTMDGSPNLLPFTILHQIGDFKIDTKNKQLEFGVIGGDRVPATLPRPSDECSYLRAGCWSGILSQTRPAKRT